MERASCVRRKFTGWRPVSVEVVELGDLLSVGRTGLEIVAHVVHPVETPHMRSLRPNRDHVIPEVGVHYTLKAHVGVDVVGKEIVVPGHRFPPAMEA
jgi:hypothetical protein